MTNLDIDDVHSRVIAAFFETKAAAEKAVAHLEEDGIPSRHITMLAGTSGTSGTAGSSTAEAAETGFMASLKTMFMPDEDSYAYAEGLRRGGYLVSVNTDEANYNRVLDILDMDGAVDMNDRETAWKAEGWKGYDASAATVATAKVATADVGQVKAAAPVTKVSGGQDESIALYEESLKVGKRDVNHGRVRLRSYVVETPFSEQVSLRSEQVQVERRPVDRAISATDAVFQDRVIEVEEHAEEAFITKEARVKEEISLRKTVENQAQTISDTVRHTEVDIEDTRTPAAGSVRKFVAASDAAMIIQRMDVIASDGTKIGTVDHLDGPDKIKLAKNTSPDGQHHYVPLSWVDHVDQHVHLNKTTALAKAGW